MSNASIESIAHLFYTRGASQYGGEAVTQLQHALQAAELAELQNGSPAAIAAALLHDIGHLLHELPEDVADNRVDDVHERLGHQWLQATFVPAVSEPVRLHVAAKRYLCTVDPLYEATLSPASVQSLQLQGGHYSLVEVQEFEQLDFFSQAIELRRWDDQAKDPVRRTPPLSHFLQFLPSVMRGAVPQEALA